MSSVPDHSSSQSTLLCIRKGEPNVCVIFAPDIGGGVIYSRKILSQIDDSISAHGFRLTPDLVQSLPQLSIQDIAKRFATDLRASALPEPYHLVGHSFAGLLAYEIACHLHELGSEVGVVALLDTAAPTQFYTGYWFRFVASARRLRDKLHRFVLTSRLFQSPEKAATIKLYPGFILLDLSKHTASHVFIIENLYDSLVRYKPSRSDFRISIFASQTLWRRSLYPKYLGWEVFSTNKELIGLNFGHNDFVGSDIAAQQVAAHLQSLVKQRC